MSVTFFDLLVIQQAIARLSVLDRTLCARLLKELRQTTGRELRASDPKCFAERNLVLAIFLLKKKLKFLDYIVERLSQLRLQFRNHYPKIIWQLPTFTKAKPPLSSAL